MKITHHHIEGCHNKPILLDSRWTRDSEVKGYVLFCHGYKGFKDWGAWNLVADHFANAGYCFIKFNFSHAGTTPEHPQEFVDLDAFGHNTYSTEVDDLNRMISWVENNDVLPKCRRNPLIFVIGHSRGGGVALLSSCENQKSIKGFAAWASVSDFEVRFPLGHAFDTWKKEGVFFVENARTKQQLPHYFLFFEDFIQNKSRLYIRDKVKQLEMKGIICHAMDDQAVHVSESMRLHKWIVNSELVLFDVGGHTFGSAHPYSSDSLPEALANVVTRTISFFDENSQIENKNEI
jgi:uncharacterized protein